MPERSSPDRRSIEVDGVAHSGPIPLGSRVGNLICSSAIPGIDPATSVLPDDPLEQVRLAFENVERFVSAAGASLDDIAKVTVFLRDDALRAAVNEAWVRLFPDESSRPARHIVVHPLPGRLHAQAELIAVAREG